MPSTLAWFGRSACCLATALPAWAQAAQSPPWRYNGEHGPVHLSELRPEYAFCARGRRQSPIDIVAPRRLAQPPLQFQCRSAAMRVANDGPTVRVRFANGSRLTIGGERHTLQQFHFQVPGGDRVRGEEFPMAVHFLHKSSTGRLISLVVLFRLGAEKTALASLLPRLPQGRQAEQVVPGVTVDPGQLIPAAHGYYAYDGSLTAPPCTEGVRWLMMKQPLELSATQLARLGQLFPSNARPVQPLRGRMVIEST